MKSVIVVRDLAASVRLGWQPEERTALQPISIDLRIEFATPPAACKSDDLRDTACYGELSSECLRVCGLKEYHLLEHLGAELLAALRSKVAPGVKLAVRVTKPHAPVPGLRGGVSFTFGEGPEAAW